MADIIVAPDALTSAGANAERRLTASAFRGLADVPSELEWFANIVNKSTRRAYENALQDFMRFTGIRKPGEFRIVTRSHVIAWRDDLVVRGLIGRTVRHRLAALSSLCSNIYAKATQSRTTRLRE